MAEWVVARVDARCGNCNFPITVGGLCLLTTQRRPRCVACAASLGFDPPPSLDSTSPPGVQIDGWTRLNRLAPQGRLRFERGPEQEPDHDHERDDNIDDAEIQ
jgi:hypothetical protein